MGKEIFEKNLEAMEKWYPPFAELIRNGNYEKDGIETELEYSGDGELVFRVKAGERRLYLNGKRNVKKPIKIWVERMGEIHKYAPVFLLGAGSGEYLKAIIGHTHQTVNVVVYEPSAAIFLRMLEEVDLSEEISSRPIAFIVKGINETELEPVITKLISLETMEFLKQEIHPNYQELFPEELLGAVKKIEKRTGFLISNSKTGVLFSTHSAKNQILNMQYLCEGYNTKRLSDAIPHDVPAVLVSAGPSLNKNIQELKQAKHKAFILAVDTAVKPLIHAGILPDAFITIDTKKVVSLVETDAIKDVPVIAPVTANYEILKEQRGKKIFYYDGHILPCMAYMAAGKVFPEVSTGGSVACSGFSLLYKMGFRTIILVGQDLAYTGGKSHADGTFQQVMPKEDTSHMMRVKGNYEETLPTRWDFKVFRDWFNMYIEGAKKHRDMRVINATAGGAFIEHTELMELKDAIRETCQKEVDYGPYIERMEPEFNGEERSKVIAYIHSVPGELEEIRRDARKLQRFYRKIMNICKSGSMDTKAVAKLLKKVGKTAKTCESRHMYQMVSATMAVAEYIVKSESLYEKDTMEGSREVAVQGLKYSKMLEQCAVLLRDFAEKNLMAIGQEQQREKE